MAKSDFIQTHLDQIIQGDGMQLLRDLPDGSVDLLLTDIPYDAVNRVGGLRKYDKGNADILTFDLTDFLHEASRVTRGTLYVFCSTEQAGHIRNTLDSDTGWVFVRHCTWHKTNPSPVGGQFFWLSGNEQCVAAKKPGAFFDGTKEKCSSNIWQSPCGSSKRHPTEKPLGLFERLVLASSIPGDLIVDPFCGSGTTGVAGIKHLRNVICAELDPDFVRVANQRLDNTKAKYKMYRSMSDELVADAQATFKRTRESRLQAEQAYLAGRQAKATNPVQCKLFEEDTANTTGKVA